MSSFPIAVTSPQLTTLRTSGYWTRVLCCLCPEEVVFRAQASQSITDEPFIEFSYDNVDVGSFSAAWEGLVCYISSTTSIRDAKYRGRVRLAADATTFRIDRNATVLNDNDKIIVVRDTDLFSQIRIDTLVDSSLTYRATPDMLSGLPSTIVLYDADNDGSVAYTTVQTPVRVASGSTSTTTWAWSVSGAGVSSISNAAVQNPTITFQAGYHYLIRVIHTNNLGQSNYQISHVYAVTRTFTAPVVRPIVTGSINATLTDGWSGTLTAYADVSTLIDRTHCTVFSLEHFGDNSSTPIVSNILLSGRIRSDSLQTEGSSEAGQIQQVTFQVEGLTAYLRRLRVPSDIIRANAAPNEWGEMIEPTPWRMACYMLWVYTNLTHITSFDAQSGLFAAWEIGGEPRGIDGGFAMDVLTNILEPIKAQASFAPDGAIRLAQTVSYLIDRSGVVLVAALGLTDMMSYTVDRDSSRTTSQVIAFGGMFNSTTNTFDVYSAQSPSIIYLEGEVKEITREILTADSTIDDAADELKERASNHYGYENAKDRWQASLYDSFAGVMIPTNFQRWALVAAAASNTLGIPYTATDYWQLQSIDLGINPDGTLDVSPEWAEETSFDDAQRLGALLPNNLSNMNPVLPILPNDPAFPTDPLENYPTETPGLDDLQALDPFSGMVAYTPFPPDLAADIALNLPAPRCKVIAVNFRASTNTESSWTTVLNDPYYMAITGFAKISGPFPGCEDLGASQGLWLPRTGFGTYDAGVGLGPLITAPDNLFGWLKSPESYSVVIVKMVFTFNETINGLSIASGGSGGRFTQTVASNMIEIDTTTAPTILPMVSNVHGVEVGFFPSYISPSSTLRMTSFCMYTTLNASDVYADWAYQWEVDADGNVINVALLSTNGLYIDNTEYTPVPLGVPFPPRASDSRYTGLPFTGTGNSFLARMELDDYTATQSAYLNIQVCPEGVNPS